MIDKFNTEFHLFLGCMVDVLVPVTDTSASLANIIQ